MPNTPACCSRAILRPAASPWSRWWQGTAENLVSGTVRPQHLPLRPRDQEAVRQGDCAPIDLGPLLEMGDMAERLFGGPQDMEWAYRDGRFHLVQSRDITRPVAGDAGHGRDAERPRPRHRHRQGRVARSGGVRQERAVGNAAAADAAVAVPHGSAVGCRRQRRSGRARARPHLPRRGRHELSRDHPRPALRRQARGAIARARHQPAGVTPAAARRRPHRARLPRELPAAVHRGDPVAERGRLREAVDGRI